MESDRYAMGRETPRKRYCRLLWKCITVHGVLDRNEPNFLTHPTKALSALRHIILRRLSLWFCDLPLLLNPSNNGKKAKGRICIFTVLAATKYNPERFRDGFLSGLPKCNVRSLPKLNW